MAQFPQSISKRQKLGKEPLKMTEATEYFAGIGKIEFKGEQAGYEDTLCYRYYNAHEKVHGKTMEEWIRPAISFTSLRLNGINSNGKLLLSNSNDNSTDDCKNFLQSCFEFGHKLGIKHWVGTDRDLTPYCNETVVDETGMRLMDDMCDFLTNLQQKYSCQPLWISPDFNFNRKYNTTTGVGSDVNMMIHISQQVKKCLEMAQKLGSEGFAVSTIGEGCNNTFITDIQTERKHFGRLLKMIIDYRDRIGYRGQLLLDAVKYRRSSSVRFRLPYFDDPLSGLCFLKHYNLDRFFKLIVDETYYHLCSGYNAVGSLEMQCDEVISLKGSTLLMKSIIEQGGAAFGGTTLEIYPSKNFTDYKEMFIMHIRQIDMLAKGLKIANKILSDQIFVKSLQQKYTSFYTGFGARLANGEINLEDCEEQIRKLYGQQADKCPHRYEHWSTMFMNYLNSFK